MMPDAVGRLTKLAALCGCLSLCLPAWSREAGAGEAVRILDAELVKQNGYYTLSAGLVYHLSDRAREALQYGVPLRWQVTVKIRRSQAYWPDAVVAARTIGFRLEYHALLNIYRVYDDNSGAADNFSNLSSALDRLGGVRDIKIIEQNALAPAAAYYAELRVAFDREALPLPLRPVAYLNSDWRLSSARYVWPLSN